MADKKKRFSNTTGSDYELFTKAYPHYTELQEAIAKAVSKKNEESFTALELGCGPGETTEVFAKKFKNAHIIAVDNEPIMIKQANNNLAKFKKRVELVQADALEYLQSVKSSSIEVFFSGFTIHNFDLEYRLKVLKEIYRILRPEGLFINGDKYALDNLNERYKAFNWAIQRFLTFYPKAGRDDSCYEWIVHMGEDKNQINL